MHTLPKQIAGVSRIVRSILLDIVTPLLGYSTIIFPRHISWCSGGFCSSTMSNRQSTSLPKLFIDALPHWTGSALRAQQAGNIFHEPVPIQHLAVSLLTAVFESFILEPELDEHVVQRARSCYGTIQPRLSPHPRNCLWELIR